MLTVKNLTVQLAGKTIVEDLSFAVSRGQWLMIVGPNGAGKSTIFNAISRAVDYSGSVFFNGQNIKEYRARDLARGIGFLAQSNNVCYPFTVKEIVQLGRYAHSSSIFSREKDIDRDRVDEAIAMTGLEPFLRQSLMTLSGGELQRAFLGQLFAQDPLLLLLDEPTNHLDLVYQKQTFSLIDQWLQKKDGAVVSIVHDLTLARAYGSHCLILDKGRQKAFGEVEEVLNSRNLNEVYSMDVQAWMQEIYSYWQ